MDDNLDGEIDVKPDEIAFSKTQLLDRDDFSILETEAYAMPSSSYVPDDSHTFFVSKDKTLCWANHGRCWEDEGDRIVVAKQNSYKEWLLEFCPPDNYDKCGITFGLTGVCHNYANRELLIGELDLSVKDAAKDYVVEAIFGKYGIGLDHLKTLITDAFTKVNYEVKMTQDMLKKVLARIDNTLEEESSAWKELMECYFSLPMTDIIKEHEDAWKKIQEMVTNLLETREKLYNEYLYPTFIDVGKFREEMFMLISNSISSYIDFLRSSNYITDEQGNIAKQSADKFIKALFGVVDEQAQAVEATGQLNQTLAKKELFM